MHRLSKIYPLLIKRLEALEENPYIRSVQRGLLTVLPLVLTGVFFVCLVNFPSQAFQGFMDRMLSAQWRSFCHTVIQGTFGIVSLAMACSIAFHMARLTGFSKPSKSSPVRMSVTRSGKSDPGSLKNHPCGKAASSGIKRQRDMTGGISPAMNVMVVLSCYIILVGSPDGWGTLFSMSQGLIAAVFSGVSASVIFFRLARLPGLRFSYSLVGNDPGTYEVMVLVPAAALTILIFTLMRILLSLIFPEGINLSYTIISNLFQKEYGDLLVGLLYIAASQLLWFFGIHGPNALFQIEQSTLHIAMLENVQTAMGYQPPYIVTKGFLDVFAYMGGSGCTLCLILAVLYKSRDNGSRRLCYLALIPALFNVNEPLLFGIPLVFNPLYIIPFIFTPLMQTLTAYIATAADLVPRTTTITHWTTPAMMSGYIATGSLAGTVLQVVNIIMGILLYLPFIMFADKIHRKKLNRAMKDLNAYAEDGDIDSREKKCMELSGMEGQLANILAEDLAVALARSLNSALPPSVTKSLKSNYTHLDSKQEHLERTSDPSPQPFLSLFLSNILNRGRSSHDPGSLFLLFQPRVSTSSCRAEGVKCLLGWNHPVYGSVSPQLIEALAWEKRITDALGSFIFRSACARYAHWYGDVCKDFIMSVSLSSGQLENPDLASEIARILEVTGTPSQNLEIEIAESLIIKSSNSTFNILQELRSQGIKITIGDFAMNYTLLPYIKEFPVYGIRVSSSLYTDRSGSLNEHLLRSVMDFSRELQLCTVVEDLKDHEQCLRFQEFGYELFQGEAFSPPLPPADCLKYITSHSRKGLLSDDKQ